MATGPCYTWSAKSIFIKLTLVHTADVIVITTSTGTTMTPSTVATTNELCSCRDCCVIIPVTTIVPTIVAISILMIVILIWIYYRKRQIALINLTKYHKESDENSYTSSKHSHESESKSPDPEYDVIKINPATDKFEFKSKLDILCQEYSSVQSNEEDWDCGPMYSSVDTNAGSPHKIGDFNVNSAIYTDIESHIKVNAHDVTDNIIIPSNGNSPICQGTAAATEDNSVKPHIYAEVDVKKKKANKDHENEISKEFVVKGDENNDEESTPPPVPPQTTEMLYVAIQNENVTEKVN